MDRVIRRGATRKVIKTPMLVPKEMNIALLKGDADAIKRLLEDSADPNAVIDINKEEQTGLMLSARDGNVECVKAFIDAGADVNAQDNSGKTALMLVAVNNNRKIFDELFRQQLSLNEKRYGNAQLEERSRAHIECARLLIAAGASPNAQDKDGNTAAMLATKKNISH